MSSKQFQAVIETNDDAATCKLSCVQLGYYEDEFVKYFVKEPIRRPPLINRGYYSRVTAIKKIIQRFLNHFSQQKRQIVILGAGFDTTAFQLKSNGLITDNDTVYELDLFEVVQKKIAILSKHADLISLISKDPTLVASDKTEIHTPGYHLVGVDLAQTNEAQNALLNSGIDTSVPTLFLSECVLIYLKPDDSNPIIKWGADTFTTATFVTYEQIKPNDQFGAVMVQNLVKRGCPLYSILAYPDIESQKKRYLDLGWEDCQVWDMIQVYTRFLDMQDIIRIQKIERFDEFEEWQLIQEHYCISWASIDKANEASNKFFNRIRFSSK